MRAAPTNLRICKGLLKGYDLVFVNVRRTVELSPMLAPCDVCTRRYMTSPSGHQMIVHLRAMYDGRTCGTCGTAALTFDAAADLEPRPVLVGRLSARPCSALPLPRACIAPSLSCYPLQGVAPGRQAQLRVIRSHSIPSQSPLGVCQSQHIDSSSALGRSPGSFQLTGQALRQYLSSRVQSRVAVLRLTNS